MARKCVQVFPRNKPELIESPFSATEREAFKLRAGKLMLLGAQLWELATVDPDELKQIFLVKKLFSVGIQPDDEVLFDKVEIEDLVKDTERRLQLLMK